MRGILVDDRDPPARLNHAADLAHRHVDLDRVLERLGGVRRVEPAVLERQRRHRSGAGAYTFRDMLQHLLGNIESPDLGLRISLFEDARESALPAAYVERPLPGEVAQMIQQQFDVAYARID